MSIQNDIIEGLLMFPMSTISSIVAIQKIKSTHDDIQAVLAELTNRGLIKIVQICELELYQATENSSALYVDSELVLKRLKHTRQLSKIKDFEQRVVLKIREIKEDQDFTQDITIKDFTVKYNLPIGIKDQVIALLHRNNYIDIKITKWQIYIFKIPT